MAFLQVNYFSTTLNLEQDIYVILPENEENVQDIPVLYLLHGMCGNHTVWQRYSRIERLVRNTNVAVVMPSTDLGFYTNTTYGMNYFDALAIELPKKIHQFFPQLSTKREKNFVAGLSMGGYGAFKFALGTNNFSHAVSLSGALFMDKDKMMEMGTQPFWQGAFGDLSKVSQSRDNLLVLAQEKLDKGEELPKMYAWCGAQDFLFEANNYVTSQLKDMGYPLTYEVEDGTHEWYYWDKMLDRVLEWLPIGYVQEERLS